MEIGSDNVAIRLVRLRRRDDGSLPRSALFSSTARAALLADLALRGALTTGSAGLELDTTADGYDPSDQLLAAVAAEPDKTVEWWVRRGPDSVASIVDDLVAREVWTRRRSGLTHHYQDNGAADVHADAARLRAVLDGAAPDTPGTAVLAALLGVVGTDEVPGGQEPTGADLVACGAAAWLVPDLIDYLLARRRLLGAAANDASIALIANLIP